MEISRLYEKIDDLYDTYIQFWQDICSIETPTDYKTGVDKLGAFLKKRASELGWQIEEDVEEVSGNALCFTMNSGSQAPAICLSAHMDTVYPLGTFGEKPVRIEGAHICGPGVADCKGGIAAAFFAAHALQELGYSSRPIKIILQSDEENSSRTSDKATVDFMIRKADGCAAFLNLEMHRISRNPDGGIVERAVIKRKGVLVSRFDVYGKATHSAKCMEGVSAVLEAAHKIIALESMKTARGLTCNCSMLRGGDAVNVVPEHCSFTADIRYMDDEQLKEARDLMKSVAEKQYVPGSRCEVTEISIRCAMELKEMNRALLKRVNEIFREGGLTEQAEGFTLGGSDASHISYADIPVLDSIGVDGENIHSTNERALLESLRTCAKRIAVIALKL